MAPGRVEVEDIVLNGGPGVADSAGVSRPNSITDAFEDVKIVVSSSWRRFYSGSGPGKQVGDLFKLLRKVGVRAPIIGRTPTWLVGQRFSQRVDRGVEIREWLSINRHLDITGYVVLDDDDDMDAVRTHFVQTDASAGLTAKTAKRARTILARRIG